MTLKERFEKVKALFDFPPATAAPAPAAPADTTVNTTFSWAVDGGATVYVDCSDDGLADIDTGDKVYTDPALSIPYPDGSYKVTGTDFAFTVAGGVVTVVVDADNAGPGAPLEQTGAAAAAPADAPPVPSLEERMAALEAKIMELSKPVTTGLAKVEELKAASQKIEIQEQLTTKHTTTLKALFDLVEQIVTTASAEPKTVTPAKQEKLNKAEAKEQKFEKIAATIKEMKAENPNN